MIAHLSGTLLYWDTQGVILDVRGVGYRVSVPASVLQRLPATGEPLSLWIHTRLTQEDLRLFGFVSQDGVRVFERLLSVPRVGPKLALSLLGQLSPAALRAAILGADVKRLASLSGVGKRTAERIIVDLAPVMKELALDALEPGAPEVGEDGVAAPTPSAALGELERALMALGYKDKEMRPALRALESRAIAGEPIETLLREALKLLR